MNDDTRSPFGLPPKQEPNAPWWDFDFGADLDPEEVFKPVILQRKANGLKGSVHIVHNHDLFNCTGLVGTLTEKLGEPASIRHNLEGVQTTFVWVWEKGMVFSAPTGTGSITCATTDEEFLHWLIATVKPFQTDRKSTSSIWLASKNQMKGLSLRRIGTIDTELEAGNYTPEVLAGYERALEDLRSSDPKGRVILLEGPPGTGKTFLVRGFIKNAVANYIIVSSKNYEDLMDPEFMESVQTAFLDDDPKLPSVFVLEDADKLLQPRQIGASLGGLSSALNMGDGLLSALMDVRIIATTNAPLASIDPAIIRAGRLSELIHVGELPVAQVRAVYKRLLPKSKKAPNSALVLADIYAKARENGWKAPPKVETTDPNRVRSLPPPGVPLTPGQRYRLNYPKVAQSAHGKI